MNINKKIKEIHSRFGGEPVYSKNKYIESFFLFVSRWSYKLTKGIYFDLKYFFQRKTRGFDDLDKWNAGWFIARKAIAVLKEWRNGPIYGTAIKRHREDRHGNIIELKEEELISDDGFPAAFTEEEWKATIDDIVFAFEFILNDDLFDGDINSANYKSNYKRHKKGLKLFSIYLTSLWD